MEIVKQNYSRSPWRLIDSEGRNISYKKSFDHPDIGMTTIIDVVSGDTKQECINNSLSLLENILNSSSALLARIAELEAKNQKLTIDAQRYRHLRDSATLDTAIWEALEGFGLDTQEGYAKGMDDAIDRAILLAKSQT